MKKNMMKVAFVAAIALIAGINVYHTQKTVTLSDIAMENVEALASVEWQNGDRIDCWTFIESPAPDKIDLTIHPIVVSCSPCGNLVIAESGSGLSKCTYYKGGAL